jgi:hypothetical protein
VLRFFSFQRGQVAAQPCGPLSDELELDCCDAGEDAGLEDADVPLTAAERPAQMRLKGILSWFKSFLVNFW